MERSWVRVPYVRKGVSSVGRALKTLFLLFSVNFTKISCSDVRATSYLCLVCETRSDKFSQLLIYGVVIVRVTSLVMKPYLYALFSPFFI